MKEILKQMVEMMKIGRHTDCGGDFDEEGGCISCSEFHRCRHNYEQTEKCEKLIEKIEATL